MSKKVLFLGGAGGTNGAKLKIAPQFPKTPLKNKQYFSEPNKTHVGVCTYRQNRIRVCVKQFVVERSIKNFMLLCSVKFKRLTVVVCIKFANILNPTAISINACIAQTYLFGFGCLAIPIHG